MADEFNPQGVDQTPRNNENPNSTADTGNAEPKNPFVGGDSVDAGNASDSSEQQAPVSSAALAADQQPTQAATDTAATEPIPDYASAKGESTVVSSSPASPAAPAAGQTSATTPLYRPAPEYGAYGPTPTQAQGQQGGQAGSNAQPTQQFPFGQPAQQTLQGQQATAIPTTPITRSRRATAIRSIRPRSRSRTTATRLPASPVRMARMASSPSRAVCSVSALPVPVRRTVKVRPSRDSPVSPAPPSRACPRRRATSSSPWSPPFWLRPSAWASVTAPSPAA